MFYFQRFSGLVDGTNFFSDPQSADASASLYRALLLP
jgi:hypothetical protein